MPARSSSGPGADCTRNPPATATEFSPSRRPSPAPCRPGRKDPWHRERLATQPNPLSISISISIQFSTSPCAAAGHSCTVLCCSARKPSRLFSCGLGGILVQGNHSRRVASRRNSRHVGRHRRDSPGCWTAVRCTRQEDGRLVQATREVKQHHRCLGEFCSFSPTFPRLLCERSWRTPSS